MTIMSAMISFCTLAFLQGFLVAGNIEDGSLGLVDPLNQMDLNGLVGEDIASQEGCGASTAAGCDPDNCITVAECSLKFEFAHPCTVEGACADDNPDCQYYPDGLGDSGPMCYASLGRILSCSTLTEERCVESGDVCEWGTSCNDIPTTCDDATAETCDLLADQCIVQDECAPMLEIALPCVLGGEDACYQNPECEYYPNGLGDSGPICYAPYAIALGCFSIGTEGECTGDCEWGTSCKDLPTTCEEATADTCGVLGADCIIQGECSPSLEIAVPCVVEFDGDSCNQKPGCEYYPEGLGDSGPICHAPYDIVFDCSTRTEDDCTGDCKWGLSCKDLPTTESEDFCDTFDFANCAVDSGNQCVPEAECSVHPDFWSCLHLDGIYLDADACALSPDCQYYPDGLGDSGPMCYAPLDVIIGCSTITTEGTCTADHLCEWSQSCSELPTTCDEASESTCDVLGEQCAVTAECGPLAEDLYGCLSLTEEGDCDLVDGCMWYPDLAWFGSAMCYVALDVVLKCSNEDTEATCGLAGCSWSHECQENGCDTKQTEDDCVTFSGCYWNSVTGNLDYEFDDEVFARSITPDCKSCLSDDDGLNFFKWHEAHAGETCTFTGSNPMMGVPADMSGTAFIGVSRKNTDGLCDGGEAADVPADGLELVLTCTTTTTTTTSAPTPAPTTPTSDEEVMGRGVHGTAPSLYVVATVTAFALAYHLAFFVYA